MKRGSKIGVLDRRQFHQQKKKRWLKWVRESGGRGECNGTRQRKRKSGRGGSSANEKQACAADENVGDSVRRPQHSEKKIRRVGGETVMALIRKYSRAEIGTDPTKKEQEEGEVVGNV